MDFDRDFQEGFDRHVRRLGYVPPEFQDHQRFHFELPEIPEFNFPRNTSHATMRRLMPMAEWLAIEDAAQLSHNTRKGDSRLAESARTRAGYGGLGPETFTITDQRPLLQGGDNHPLD